MKSIFVIAIGSLILSATGMLFSQQSKEGENMMRLLRSANSKELAQQFNASVQLTLPEKSDRFNRNQAEIVMREFFVKYPPKSAALAHQGVSTDGSQYFIGEYTSGTTKYRTYILYKKVGDTFFIHQLRIEVDD